MKFNKDKCKAMPLGRKKPFQLRRGSGEEILGVLECPELGMGQQWALAVMKASRTLSSVSRHSQQGRQSVFPLHSAAVRPQSTAAGLGLPHPGKAPINWSKIVQSHHNNGAFCTWPLRMGWGTFLQQKALSGPNSSSSAPVGRWKQISHSSACPEAEAMDVSLNQRDSVWKEEMFSPREQSSSRAGC